MRDASQPTSRPPNIPGAAPGVLRDASEVLGDASDLPARIEFWCECCGRNIVTAIDGLFYNPQTGSPRRFCDPGCRQAAYRRRKAGTPENTPLQYTGGRNRKLNKEAPTNE
jgi:hypothetical protein